MQSPAPSRPSASRLARLATHRAVVAAAGALVVLSAITLISFGGSPSKPGTAGPVSASPGGSVAGGTLGRNGPGGSPPDAPGATTGGSGGPPSTSAGKETGSAASPGPSAGT